MILCAALCGATVRDSVTVHFRQSRIVISPDYMGNRTTLDSIFRHLGPDSAAWQLKAVSVTGAASPEGSVKFNKYLSEKRARAIFDTFDSHGFLTDSVATSFIYLGRDWNGLRELVKADEAVPYRDDVLELLDEIAGQNPPAHPLQKMKALHGGVPYIYMYNRLFPQLRRSQLVVEYYDLYPAVAALPREAMSVVEVAENKPVMPEMTLRPFLKPITCKPFYMGLKTNLVYDALLLPTVGAEFYVGRDWSVLADWTYGWWDRNRTHYYWRAYGGTLGARKWFGEKAAEKPLTGHHLGAFAGVITYDFELGGTGYMGGLPGRTLWDRCNYVCGVEYGYSLPIARRLNLDFSLALGYIGGKYYKYIPRDGKYEWQSTHRLNWFGPTKAEVSLVWLIGCDNYNRMKGGRK